MTLTRKFVLFNASLVTLVAVFGGTTIWQAADNWQTTRSAAAQYAVMDRAQSASTQVYWLENNLRTPQGNSFRDVKYLAPLRTEARNVLQEVVTANSDSDGVVQRQLAQSAITHLDTAASILSSSPAVPAAGQPDLFADHLQQAEKSLNDLTTLAPNAARRQVTVAAASMHDRLLWMVLWLVGILGMSTFIHMRQYKALVKPLIWLRDDMRQSAGREFKEPIKARGDGEFQEVAGYFNGLARDLAQLYKDLEQKVIARSRELVRSERLASVGYLAAGVAHEINNPLSIISGYAELAGKDLQVVLANPGGTDASAESDAEALSSALQAQEIIREEAFRCKEITHRLLSLARGGGDGRVMLSLAETARQVASLTRGLRHYRNRRVDVDFAANDMLPVHANPTEMKQVLLNLIVNALEASPADRGVVRIAGRTRDQSVEITIEDNGKGMPREVLEQIFEPFFTNKRGTNEPGTGLGLSITHAIIEGHGGRIQASSPGPGLGSRFTITLPAATQPAPVNGKHAAALRA